MERLPRESAHDTEERFEPVSSAGIEQSWSDQEDGSLAESIRSEDYPSRPGFAHRVPYHPKLLPADEAPWTPMPSYQPRELPSPESVHAQAGVFSSRHRRVEAEDHIPIVVSDPKLTEERMNAPSLRSEGIAQSSGAPSSEPPEESGVRLRLPLPSGAEIVSRRSERYQEVERPDPDTFIGHGTIPTTEDTAPNEPSVMARRRREVRPASFLGRVAHTLVGPQEDAPSARSKRDAAA